MNERQPSIEFSLNRDDGYYVSKYWGTITDTLILNSYRQYYESGNWVLCTQELADLSEADVSKITGNALRDLASFLGEVCARHKIDSVYTAVWAPSDVSFGVSRMYEAIAAGSPDHTRVFRDLNEAVLWLRQHKR